MIAIIRSECPDVLRPGATRRKQAEELVVKIISKGQMPKSEDFKKVWGKPAVREALHAMQKGRCCYCERLRDVNRESDVEHFRPKARVTENPGGGGYWWLAYEWDNLLFSCRRCNQHFKMNHFPVRGKRAVKAEDSLNEEKPDLIHPCEEDPEEHISYDWVTIPEQVFPSGRGESRRRGDQTIAVCGLDDPSRCLARFGILSSLQALALRMSYALYLEDTDKIAKFSGEIRAATSARNHIEFLGFRRWFFRTQNLGEYVANN